MWFTYNGLVHYAGSSKPKVLCSVDSFKDNNWLRVQSYTGWLLNHYWLYDKCVTKDILYEQCVSSSSPQALATITSTTEPVNKQNLSHHHIIHPKTLIELTFWMSEILKFNSDMNYVYIKIGISPLKDDLVANVNEVYYKKLMESIKNYNISNPATSINTNEHEEVDDTVLKVIEHLIFYQSLWSIRVYDHTQEPSNLNQKLTTLRDESLRYHTSIPPTLPPSPQQPQQQQASKKKGGKRNTAGPPVPPPNIPDKRIIKSVTHLPACEMIQDRYVPSPIDFPKTYARNCTTDPTYYVQVPCVSILNNVKDDKNGHVEVYKKHDGMH